MSLRVNAGVYGGPSPLVPGPSLTGMLPCGHHSVSYVESEMWRASMEGKVVKRPWQDSGVGDGSYLS